MASAARQTSSMSDHVVCWGAVLTPKRMRAPYDDRAPARFSASRTASGPSPYAFELRAERDLEYLPKVHTERRCERGDLDDHGLAGRPPCLAWVCRGARASRWCW